MSFFYFKDFGRIQLMRKKYLFISLFIIFLFCVSAVSAAENGELLQNNDNLEKLTTGEIAHKHPVIKENSNKTWYVDSGVSSSGNGMFNAPFKTLKEAVSTANDGDTINIAPGVYSGAGNVYLKIDKNVNLVNNNDKDVIFDGEGSYSMFAFTGDCVNITGLTFKNAMGFTNIPIFKEPAGVLFFENGLKNCKINANFIGNNLMYCGVITSTGDISNVDFDCYFKDNTGGFDGGSLIHLFSNALKNSNIICRAENNIINDNFVKTIGIYNTTVIMDLKDNKAKRGKLAIVKDRSINNNSNCAIRYLHNPDLISAAYDGKSSSIKLIDCLYVDGNVEKSGLGMINSPYKTLKETINHANDGDTIYIAPGTYKGLNNTWIDVYKKLSLVNWGDGDVIFDGEGKNKMFYIYAESFNVINLTFKNGRGADTYQDGLITLRNGLKNSTIKATFIDNVMPYCGVITLAEGEINGVDFDCRFIHNEGGWYEGSLIYSAFKPIKNSNIKCYATDNYYDTNMIRAKGFFNVNITGYFADNKPKFKAKSLIKDELGWAGSSFSITDSIIFDRYECICEGWGGKVDFSRNWLGNTRDNADKALLSGIHGWLFLDMDIPIDAVDNFTTQLKFSSYNLATKTSSSYDDKKLFLPIDGFTLEAKNGHLDKNNVHLHENFTYTADDMGKGSIIAKHGQFTLKQDIHNLEFSEAYVSPTKGHDIAGTGFEDHPFESLQRAMESIDEGGTIYLLEGTYTGEKNINLNITKQISILKHDKGDAIFDAKCIGRIFTVNVNTLVISGLTLKSGAVTDNGGAIRFNKDLVNSVINLTYINNIAKSSRGGALYFNGDIYNSTIEGTYSNSQNPVGYGGGIFVNGKVVKSTIKGSFINNMVSIGSAIFFNGDVIDSLISGECINNTVSSYGTIYFKSNVFNSTMNVTFENNNVMLGDSSAFYVNGKFLNSIIDGVFKGNSALDGSVIFFNDEVKNLTMSGRFEDNTRMISGPEVVFKGAVDDMKSYAEFIDKEDEFPILFANETSKIIISNPICENATDLKINATAI